MELTSFFINQSGFKLIYDQPFYFKSNLSGKNGFSMNRIGAFEISRLKIIGKLGKYI